MHGLSAADRAPLIMDLILGRTYRITGPKNQKFDALFSSHEKTGQVQRRIFRVERVYSSSRRPETYFILEKREDSHWACEGVEGFTIQEIPPDAGSPAERDLQPEARPKRKAVFRILEPLLALIARLTERRERNREL